jgi:hypothetical protein
MGTTCVLHHFANDALCMRCLLRLDSAIALHQHLRPHVTRRCCRHLLATALCNTLLCTMYRSGNKVTWCLLQDSLARVSGCWPAGTTAAAHVSGRHLGRQGCPECSTAASNSQPQIMRYMICMKPRITQFVSL